MRRKSPKALSSLPAPPAANSSVKSISLYCRMQERPIAGTHCTQSRWWCKQTVGMREVRREIIAIFAPAIGAPFDDYEGCVVVHNGRAVREIGKRHGEWMDALEAVTEALAVQNRIHCRCGWRHIQPVCFGPCGTKRLGRCAATCETGTMACGERHGLVKKEQLRPTALRHDIAPMSLVTEGASDPCLV